MGFGGGGESDFGALWVFGALLLWVGEVVSFDVGRDMCELCVYEL